jgi:hypothetical protein
MKASSMTPEYLISKGWRKVADVHKHRTHIVAWDHPDHQPWRRGYFSTTSAKEHQELVETGGACYCIPRNGGERWSS